MRISPRPLFTSLGILFSLLSNFVSLGQDLTLDRSFGVEGKILFAYNYPAQSRSYSMVLQPDGKSVQYGAMFYGSGPLYDSVYLSVTRYHINGTIDNSFAVGGQVRLPLGQTTLPVSQKGIALQPDGKMLIASSRYNAVARFSEIIIFRLNANGSADISFGVEGKLTLDIGLYDDYASSVIVQPDGKILVGGSSFNGFRQQFALFRLKIDGSFDHSFGWNGIASSLSFGHGTIEVVRLQPDGKILIAGNTWGENHDFAVARMNNDGSLDNSFDSDGLTIIRIGSGADVPYDLALQTDGKILVAGSSQYSTNVFFSIVRLHKDGSLDNSFSGDGKHSFDFGGPTNRAHTVLVQNDGKIILAGQADLTGWGWKSAFARLKPDGSMDGTFGPGGKMTIDIVTTWASFLGDAVLQKDGKLLSFSAFPGGVGLMRFMNYSAAAGLPVILTKFYVVAESGSVKLSWETSFEKNSKGFYIQRAQAGTSPIAWKAIAFVGGRNNNGSGKYQLIDDQPLEGTSYYRLKQVDLDEKVEFSETRVVKLVSNPLRFSVSSNPVRTPNISLSFQSNYSGVAKLTLTDIQGRAVLDRSVVIKNGKLSSPIFITGAKSGIFTIKIAAANQQWIETVLISY